MRRTIAVDIDDVLAVAAQGFVDYSNHKWGTNLKVDDYTEHWAELWGTNQTESNQRAQHIYKSHIQSTFNRFDDAEPILLRLSKKYKLVIVTSRHKLVRQTTLDWLEKHFKGIFSDVHFAGIWDAGHDTLHALNLTKAQMCKELGAEFLIDDHPKHCLAVAEIGLQALLFGSYSWNKDIKLTKGVTRVKDWHVVAEYFGV